MNVTLFFRKAGGDADDIHRICCPSGLFHPYYLFMITLTLHILEEKRMMTLSRVIGIITREFYTRKFGFEVLGDNVKVFYEQG